MFVFIHHQNNASLALTPACFIQYLLHYAPVLPCLSCIPQFLLARHAYMAEAQGQARQYVHDYQAHVLKRLEAQALAQATEM